MYSESKTRSYIWVRLLILEWMSPWPQGYSLIPSRSALARRSPEYPDRAHSHVWVRDAGIIRDPLCGVIRESPGGSPRMISDTRSPSERQMNALGVDRRTLLNCRFPFEVSVALHHGTIAQVEVQTSLYSPRAHIQNFHLSQNSMLLVIFATQRQRRESMMKDVDGA